MNTKLIEKLLTMLVEGESSETSPATESTKCGLEGEYVIVRCRDAVELINEDRSNGKV